MPGQGASSAGWEEGYRKLAARDLFPVSAIACGHRPGRSAANRRSFRFRRLFA
ncbi:hypothetical protein RGUI_3590 [Rhodovulum sp. P5]|nr:hypothetical protein RGUI_3590 [Rhodovulum sp. P5]